MTNINNDDFPYDQHPSPQQTNINDKNLSVLVHVLAIFTSFLAPLIFYIIYKDKPGLVKDNSREALNFSLLALLSMIALTIVSSILTVVTLGLLSFTLSLIYLPIIIAMVFQIIAAVKTHETGFYQYPINIPFVK